MRLPRTFLAAFFRSCGKKKKVFHGCERFFSTAMKKTVREDVGTRLVHVCEEFQKRGSVCSCLSVWERGESHHCARYC